MAESAARKKTLVISAATETDLAARISALTDRAYAALIVLNELIASVKQTADRKQAAFDYHDKVLSAMNELRANCDELEKSVSKEYWPFPTYSELLFSV